MTSEQTVVVEIVGPHADWPRQFGQAAADLRRAFGDLALRIDHIGSTSVPGLGAKDVLDIQVTAADPAVLDEAQHPVRGALDGLGFCLLDDNDDRRKRFLRRRVTGLPHVNLHVRRDGCVSQQQALLFRDYLRASLHARSRYEAEKRRLATSTWPSIDDYADAKGDVIWTLLREADVWSWAGWRPGPSDA